MHRVAILPTGGFDSSFLYLSDEMLEVGDVVLVPFGSREIIGLVTDDQLQTDKPLKRIISKYEYNIGKINYDFLCWVAAYTLIPKGIVLQMILSEKTVFTSKKPIEIIGGNFDWVRCDINLSDQQSIAFHQIIKNGSKPFLLHGVTGSGKTEIYLSLAKKVIDENNHKQVLILLPEIALTQQISKKIEHYFGEEPLIWNSGVSAKCRRKVWNSAICGSEGIFIGARSALFLPFKNLGLIIVDEEHDQSYKQHEGGCYNARDMAVVLSQLHKIPIVLSSATPSLESYVNAKSNKYCYVSIENRFGVSKLPLISLIDMRHDKYKGFISTTLLNAIQNTISRNEQCLLYLNRRGYAPITLCKSCGEKISCPNCSSWLVFHKKLGLVCHYCGHKASIPHKCISCDQENSYIQFGPGIERIYEELLALLPHARIAIASSDTLSSPNKIQNLFDQIANHEIDIIIGTQILAKGHHFPDITLVGIVDGDLGLHGADLRASEKTYQMINQVAGRAGRAEKPGQILIQTFNTEHPLYKIIQSNHAKNFFDNEAALRKQYNQPPFSKFVSIIVSGTNKQLTEDIANKLRQTCPDSIKILGPAPAPLFLLRGRVRWRILLKISKKISTNDEIKKWIRSNRAPKNVKIQIDIDPISFF